MLAAFAALATEGHCLKRYLAGPRRADLGGLPLIIGEYAGQPVLLCHTGPGRRAESAARAVLSRYSPQCVLSLGFAGGVAEDLRSGDIIICQRMYLWGGEETAPAQESDGQLVELAEAAAQKRSVPYRKGTSATAARLLGRPAEKGELATRLPVQIVEMESYWVARAARQRGVPFLAMRAVLDSAADALPETLASVGDSGSIRWRPLLAHLGTHPGSLLQLPRLARSTLRAKRSLTAVVGEFLELWSRQTAA